MPRLFVRLPMEVKTSSTDGDGGKNREGAIKAVDDLLSKSLQHYHRHRYKDAKLLLSQALTAARVVDPPSHLHIARALGNLANTTKELQEYARAVELYEEALEAFAHVGDVKRQGIILFNAALTYRFMRKWKDVIRLMEKRLTLGDDLTEEVVKKAQDLIIEANDAIERRRKADELQRLQHELQRAKLLVQSRQNNKALLKLAAVYSEAETCQVEQIQANCLVQTARVHTRMGQKEAALEELNRACALHRSSNKDVKGEHTALGDLAALLIATQRPEQAIAILQQKVELSVNEQERVELVTRITQMRADVNSVNVVVPASQFINSVGGNRTEGELQLQRAELDAKKERELMQLCFKDIPFLDVLQRAEQAQQTLDQLIPLLRTHAEGEDQLGKILNSGLQQTNAAASFFGVGGSGVKAKFQEPGTLGQALNTLRQDTLEHSQEARVLASRMQDLVVSPLTKHKQNLKQATKRLSTQALRSQAVVKKAKNAVEHATQTHQKIFEQVEKTRKLLEGVDITTKDGSKKQNQLSSKLNKLVVQREDAREAVRKCIEMKEIADHNYAADLVSIADDYQRAELVRLDVVKEHAKNMVRLEIEAADQRRKRLNTLMTMIDLIDPTSDVRLYSHSRRVQEMLFQTKSKHGTINGSSRSGGRSGERLGRQKEQEDQQHYESGHRLLHEIVLGLFADAELHDTNFQRKKVAEQKKEKTEEKKETEKDKSKGKEKEEKNKERGKMEERSAAEFEKQSKDDRTPKTKENMTKMNSLHSPSLPLSIKSIENIQQNMEEYSLLFHHESNRSMFVKLLNLQRSKVQNVGIGYSALATLMCNYLDCCAKQSDVRSAKMIMIMSETFYRHRQIIDGSEKNSKQQRTETREYLQTHIRQHGLWHNPHFWEEAFFMSCREEVNKHMERATELASHKPEEFKRVYVNICFGQLGSYVLNACTFGFGLQNVHAFIEKMCSVNDLSDAQKSMLIENANAVFAQAQENAKHEKRDSVVAPKFVDSPKVTTRTTSDSVVSVSSDTSGVEYM